MDAKTFITDNAFFFIAVAFLILIALNKKRAEKKHNAKSDDFLNDNPDAASLSIFYNPRSSGFKNLVINELGDDVYTTIKGKYIVYHLLPGNYTISADYFYITQPFGSKRKTINTMNNLKFDLDILANKDYLLDYDYADREFKLTER